ncbi:MAG: hypothetical protein H0T76_24550 [Nannocystis sp.]|nr:hypothetical protein [Nannocystis sp.]MBA3549661.1 hypothetical protein [Nannocystis sp.]
MTKPRHATDVAEEIRGEERQKHAEALARHSAHLCINGWRDVVWITGALGAGVVLAKVAEGNLKGRWRAMPMVVGLILSIAARRTDPQTTRFVTKAALAVGGFALGISTIHFTMQARIDADQALEV